MKKNRSIALAFAAGVSVTVFLVSLPAWALSCNACVDASDIVDGQVKAAEIATGAVGTSELAAGAVRVSDIGVLPAARVCNSSPQSISNGASVELSYPSETFDGSLLHDAAAPTKLSARVPGVYQVHATVAWVANSTGVRAINILRNDTTTIASTEVLGSAGNVTLDVSALVKLAAGEYVESRVVQTSGGPLNTRTLNECNLVVFEMHFVSAG